MNYPEEEKKNPPRLHPFVVAFVIFWVLVALSSMVAAVAVNL